MRILSYVVSLFLLPIFLSAEISDGKQANFNRFTGKVSGKKVRLRTAANIDSHIVKQLNKGDLIIAAGEKNGFYAVYPEKKTKLFIYKKFIKDNTVAASRVNVRLSPSTDAPIVGRFQKGAKVNGQTSLKDDQWLEIDPPENLVFYVAKDYISKVGTENYVAELDSRCTDAEKMLNTAEIVLKKEAKKSYPEMNLFAAQKEFEKVITSFSDFPSAVKKAKEGLTHLKELSSTKKESFLASQKKYVQNIPTQKNEKPKTTPARLKPSNKEISKTLKALANSSTKEQMKSWITSEEEIFSSWTIFHPEKSVDEFYKEQMASSFEIKGTIEPFSEELTNKPGDYMLKSDSFPEAYLYSTKVNLDEHIGRFVTISVTPRPNYNFAYPAYFVFEIK